MSNLTKLYIKLYDEYSAKYGQNTAIFLLVGKFYELYDYYSSKTGEPNTSLKRAVELMNIALKEKPGHGPQGETGLWAGVPEQSLHKFAQMLTKDGWTVVVVDQVKDSGDTVIDRIPTRVLSPGTHVEMATQDRMSIAALWHNSQEKLFAASVLDLTTGEVFSTSTHQIDTLLHMFQVYCVREVIAASLEREDTLKSMFGLHCPLHCVSPSLFSESFAGKQGDFRREEFFRTMFRIRGMLPLRQQLHLPSPPDPILESALCLLLRFVQDHFRSKAELLTSHRIYQPSSTMRLSNNILEQLNILTTNGQKSILSLLDRTQSAIGKRALRERVLRPITQPEELLRRWEQVAWAITAPAELLQAAQRSIKQLYDMPRLHYKIAEGWFDSADALQLFTTYSATGALMKLLQETPLTCPEALAEKIQTYRESFAKLVDEAGAAEREKEKLRSFLTPMAAPRTASHEATILKLEEEWKKQWEAFAGGNQVLLDFALESKNEDWTWEGPRSSKRTLEAAVAAANSSKNKQTPLTQISIDAKKSGPIEFTCREFQTHVSLLRKTWAQLQRALKEEIRTVCDDLWDQLRSFQEEWIEWLGRIDVTLTLAAVAKDLHWCQPTLGDGLVLEGLRHPLLEAAQTRVEYVKHDVKLGAGAPGGWLIYGVNASGKSSLMKSVGIACVLAQAGSFVPASHMVLRPYDAAFSRIWNHDNVWAGLSSFAVEVTELRDILAGATDRSLILGDEVCSGTESLSATSLVSSVLEHLDRRGAHFMFATHLHDLMKVPGLLPRPGIAVWHLRVETTVDGKLIYDRRLQPGSGSCTYGLEVAKAMGIPFTLLQRAHEIRRALTGEAAAHEAPKSSWNAQIQRKKCERCGKGDTRELEVHHIIPRSEGGSNALRNLVVLCERCHDEHHNGNIEIGPLRSTSEGEERLPTDAGLHEPESEPEPMPEPKPQSKRSSKSKSPLEKSLEKWTSEEQETIRRTTLLHKSRPISRIFLALQEEGISIKESQLKKLVPLILEQEQARQQ